MPVTVRLTEDAARDLERSRRSLGHEPSDLLCIQPEIYADVLRQWRPLRYDENDA